jgi:ABC-type polysaccharide/polyol phosphate transport system ATPase subunit
MEIKIPQRIAATLLNALKGGVVPRVGLGHITVGRRDEIDALLHDVETIEEGGASFRFVVGKYGAGKSFLLQAIRNYAMDRGFVVADADLSPERRLNGSKGEGLATYREMMKNLSVKTSPEGGAINLLLSKWITKLKNEVMAEENINDGDPDFNKKVEIKIHAVIEELQAIVHGFDFAKVISVYWHAAQNDDGETKNKALKWLRGEYETKTEAKNDLGVSVRITDDDWYEYIKLFALFAVKAGYSGMLMIVDELVNIFKIPNSVSRQYNYEKILTIYNDIMQGKAGYLGVIMSGTPQCIEDTRRGVFSYEALKSRLEGSRFADENTRDLLSPIIRLKALTPDEMYVLAEKLSKIHGQVYHYEPHFAQEDLAYFIKREFARVGASGNITPREMIRDFIQICDIILQNPDRTIRSILGGNFAYAQNMELGEPVQDEFKGFEI